MRSDCASSEVTSTTGSSAVAASARSRRHISYPSMPGMRMSETTMSGRAARTRSSALSPSSAVSTS